MNPDDGHGSTVCDETRDAARWKAIARRDPAWADGFFYGVSTTGVYCRPGCPARKAKRQHIRFFETCDQAASAGFRPCKRCTPEKSAVGDRQSEMIARVCRAIERAEDAPRLEDLAHGLGLSPRHLHRLFKKKTGITPRAYAEEQRLRRVKQGLRSGKTVTAAIYDAGYHTASRFYENSGGMLGMQPGEYREGGTGSEVSHAIVPCSLGFLLVAATRRGICAIRFGDDAEILERELRNDYPRARLVRGDASFNRWVEAIIELTDHGVPPSPELPLDIRGTAFQRRVWHALRGIRSGETATYAEIAARIGAAKASRAVGLACASNPLAVLIPCHRVVRKDGSLGGYRWGIERKKELLRRERDG